jgi:hypothetical protein
VTGEPSLRIPAPLNRMTTHRTKEMRAAKAARATKKKPTPLAVEVVWTALSGVGEVEGVSAGADQAGGEATGDQTGATGEGVQTGAGDQAGGAGTGDHIGAGAQAS